MFISWDGLATVVRGVSSVIFAEILLAYLMHGYSDMVTIYIIIFIIYFYDFKTSIKEVNILLFSLDATK